MIDRFRKIDGILLAVNVVGNLALLGFFKYYDFFIGLVNSCFKTTFPEKNIPLPIGISFFTFQILSYVIDLYRGRYPVQKNILNLALYISFFPQLIAGPIVRYVDIDRQLESRTHSTQKAMEGIRRFLYGLGKKVLIANVLGQCVDSIYAMELSEVTGAFAWLAAGMYMLQIYYDFSGYSDMAIGLGKLFGFDFPENFNYPYLSKSVQEFWRRWHISLGTWFREYLYFPLGGSRKGAVRTYVNLMIVFLVTGLWHGAGMTFVLWGVYYGVLQVIERLGFKKILGKYPVIGWSYTFLAALFGWVFIPGGHVCTGRRNDGPHDLSVEVFTDRCTFTKYCRPQSVCDVDCRAFGMRFYSENMAADTGNETLEVFHWRSGMVCNPWRVESGGAGWKYL